MQAECINSFKLETVKNVLEDLGFEVLASELKGESGLKYRFALVAEKDGKRLVFDILEEGNVENSLLSIMAKAYDTKAECIALTGGELNGKARRLAELCGIRILNLNSDLNEEFNSL